MRLFSFLDHQHMELILQRTLLHQERTPGHITIGEKLTCWTLEDAVHDGPKIPGKTAIPVGRYEILLTFSNRFKRELPILLDVPNFEGIRIHGGNTEADTEGCILVGRRFVDTRLVASQLALSDLLNLLDRTLDKERVYIEVRNPEIVDDRNQDDNAS